MDARSDEVLLESFKFARAEISDRIRLRDQTLAAYLAAVVGIVGFALSQQSAAQTVHTPDLLLFAPALAFAAAKAIADNHNMVGALALYQALELRPLLGAATLPLWERSRSLLDPDGLIRQNADRAGSANASGRRSNRTGHAAKNSGRVGRRTGLRIDDIAVTDTIAIVGPAVAALVLHAVSAHGWYWRASGGFWGGVALLVWSGALLFRARNRRKRIRRLLLSGVP